MNSQPLEIVSSARYLGLVVDSHPNFEEHIAQLQRAAAAGVSIIKGWYDPQIRVARNSCSSVLLAVHHIS